MPEGDYQVKVKVNGAEVTDYCTSRPSDCVFTVRPQFDDNPTVLSPLLCVCVCSRYVSTTPFSIAVRLCVFTVRLQLDTCAVLSPLLFVYVCSRYVSTTVLSPLLCVYVCSRYASSLFLHCCVSMCVHGTFPPQSFLHGCLSMCVHGTSSA